jgi:hypothetical protein
MTDFDPVIELDDRWDAWIRGVLITLIVFVFIGIAALLWLVAEGICRMFLGI